MEISNEKTTQRKQEVGEQPSYHPWCFVFLTATSLKSHGSLVCAHTFKADVSSTASHHAPW